MNQYSYGKAKLSDALRISVLLKTAYIETYATEGITFEFANFINKRFSTQHIEEIIQTNQEQLLIAYFNNNPIGVAEIFFKSNCPIRKITVPELSKLYVLKRFNGKGVGYGLLTEIEEILQKKGLKELNLEVLSKNNRATSFYKRQGFQKIGEADFPMEKNVYRNDVMNKVFS